MTDKKYIKTFSGKQVDASQLSELISKNLEAHADYYEKSKGIDKGVFTQKVEDIYNGLVNGSYQDRLGGISIPEGDNSIDHEDQVSKVAAYFVKKALQNATAVEVPTVVEEEEDPDLFGNLFTKTYGIPQNPTKDDFSNWSVGGLFNRKQDHSDAAQELSAFITNKIVPSSTTNKKEWQQLASALMTKGDSDEGLIGNSDKKLAIKLGGKSLSNLLDYITGNVKTPREAKIDQMIAAGIQLGYTPEQAKELAEKQLQYAYDSAMAPFKKQEEEKQKAEELKTSMDEFTEYAAQNWSGESDAKETSQVDDYDNVVDRTLSEIGKDWLKIPDQAILKQAWRYLRGDYSDKVLRTFFREVGDDTNIELPSIYSYINTILFDLSNEYDRTKTLNDNWVKYNDIYFLKGSFNQANGSVLVFNPISKRLYRAKATGDDYLINSPDYLQEAYKVYETKIKPASSKSQWGKVFVNKNKQGAKLKQLRKFSTGGIQEKADTIGRFIIPYDPSKDLKEDLGLSTEEGELSDADKERIRKGNPDQWYDAVRKWSTILDVTGAGASFVPVVGHFAGPVLGTLGTVGHLVADWHDPTVSDEEKWKNFGVNAALTSLYAIPSGGALKALKEGKTAIGIGKGILKTAKAGGFGLASTAAISDFINDSERNKELWKKWRNDSLTQEEAREFYQKVSMYSGTLTGLRGVGLRGIKYLPDSKAWRPVKHVLATAGDPFGAIAAKTPGIKKWIAPYYEGYLHSYIDSPTSTRSSITIPVTDGGGSRRVEISENVASKIRTLVDSYMSKRGWKQKAKEIANGKGEDFDNLMSEINKIYKESQLSLSPESKVQITNSVKVNPTNDITVKGILRGKEQDITISKDILNSIRNQLTPDANGNINVNNDYVHNLLLNTLISENVDQKQVTNLLNTTNTYIYDNVADEVAKNNRQLDELTSTRIGKIYKWGRGLLRPTDYSHEQIISSLRTKLGPIKSSVYSDNHLLRFANENIRQNGDDINAVISKIESMDDTKLMDDIVNWKPTKKSTNTNTGDATDANQTSSNTTQTDTPVNTNDVSTQSTTISQSQNQPTNKGNQSNKGNKGNKSKKKRKHMNGGSLDLLKQLRKPNFITDTPKLSIGGIVKAQNGDNTNEWITKHNPHGGLSGWSADLDKSEAGSLKDNPYHGEGDNLNKAIAYIKSYINTPGQAQGDIQSYIDANNFTDVNSFLTTYNNDINALHDLWKKQKYTTGTYGASTINDLYKKLYTSTTAADQLGWEEGQKNKFGATTNARRVIVRNGELQNLSPEEFAKRAYTVKVNGEDVTVAVNADGTLVIQRPTSLTENQSSETQGLELDKKGDPKLNGSPKKTKIIDTSAEGGIEEEQPEEELNYWGEDPNTMVTAFQRIYPEMLDLARYLDNKRNNERILQLGLAKKAVYKSPIQFKRNVYGDFGSLTAAQNDGDNLMSTMHRMARLTNSPEKAAAIMLDAQMRQNNIVNAGRKLDNAAIAQSFKESQQVDESVYKYNKEVGDSNIAAAVAKHNYDLDLKAAKDSANTTNRNSFLMGREQRARQEFVKNQDTIKNINLLRLENLYKRMITDTPVIKHLRDQYNASTSTEERLKLSQQIQQEIQKNEAKFGKFFFNAQTNILQDKSLPEVPYKLGKIKLEEPVWRQKKGGKLTNHRIKRDAEDLRELRKQIRFNITSNQKMLNNLSKATLLELKKMMDI